MEQTKKTRQEIEELFKSGVISKEEYDNLSEETRDHEQSHDKGITQYIIPVIATLAILGIPFALVFWNTDPYYQQGELEEDCDSCCISSATSKDLDRSNDYLADDKGEPLLIDLGTFTDIQNFSKGAQRTFKEGIFLQVAVSKDMTRSTVVSLGRKIPVTGSDEVVWYAFGDSINSIVSYGPIIYRTGGPWIDPETVVGPKEKQKYIDYQPICLLNGVKLENIPSAEKASEQLLRFLKYTGKLRWNEETKQATKANGLPLTEHEYETAKRFKLITTKKVLFFFEKDDGVHPIYKKM